MLNDFSISAKQRLLTYFIEQEPGLGLTESNLVLSAPRKGVFTDKNTEVTATYVNTLVHKPTTVAHYNRLKLQTYFENNFGGQTLFLNTQPNIETALAAVLSEYNTALTAEDVSLNVSVGNITLLALPNSYGWTGSISFATASGGFQLDGDGDENFQLDNDTFFELD